MDRKFQIFISSTYIDLIDERQEVTRQILNNYHFPIGMEMFAPSDMAQRVIIENTIKSSDIYVLLLGYRYGSTLKIDDGREISYTEKEFEYAVEKHKPIIVFLKEDDDLIFQVKRLKEKSVEERSATDTWRETLKKITGINYGPNQIERLKSAKTGADILDYIYANKYDEDQAKIEAFRSKVHDRLLGKFSKKIKIDVQHAIAEKIKSLPSGGWVQEKNVRRSYLSSPKYLLAMFTILICIIGISYYIVENKIEQNRITIEKKFHHDTTADLRRKALVKNLIVEHFELFKPASESNLEFARVIPSSAQLNSETNLSETFALTTDTFKISTPKLQLLQRYFSEVLSAVRKGVKFRILLLNPTDTTYEKLNRSWFYNPIRKKERDNMEGARVLLKKTITDISTIIATTKREKDKGGIDLKFYNKPMHYGMWLKDPGKPDGLGHFSISTYDGFTPVFRITESTSKRLFNILNNQFDIAWADKSNVDSTEVKKYLEKRSY